MSDFSRRVFIIGASQVGLAMAQALKYADFQIVGIWNRSDTKAETVQKLIECPFVSGSWPDSISNTDLILVCVRDDAITEIGHRLSKITNLKSSVVIAHTSGCLSAQVLGAITNARLGSIHPLVAISDITQAIRQLRSAYFALEGHPEAIQYLEQVVTLLGGRSFTVPPDSKALYHATAVMASNYIVGLLDQAIQCAEHAGISNAHAYLSQLAFDTMQQIQARGTLASLTGPIVRGDINTLMAHTSSLRDLPLGLYQLLGKVVLQMAEQKSLSKSVAEKIDELLKY